MSLPPTSRRQSTASPPPVCRVRPRSARRSGRSTTARCGRSTNWSARDFASMPAWRRSRSSAVSTTAAIRTRRETAAGPIVEVPPLVADRFGQVMPLGWGWGLRMSSPRRVLRGDRRGQRRWPSRGADGPSVGARSGSSASASSPQATIRALLPAGGVRGASERNRECRAVFDAGGNGSMRTFCLTRLSSLAIALLPLLGTVASGQPVEYADSDCRRRRGSLSKTRSISRACSR